MPVVAFSGASGLTEERVSRMVIDEMIDRVDEIRKEMRSALNGMEAITTRFGRAVTMTQPEADAEFGNLDAQLRRVLELRQTLQVRVDCLLSQQRQHAAAYAAQPQTKVA